MTGANIHSVIATFAELLFDSQYFPTVLIAWSLTDSVHRSKKSEQEKLSARVDISCNRMHSTSAASRIDCDQDSRWIICQAKSDTIARTLQ
jgi:hypothetical protein